VVCSLMLYTVTKRAFWSGSRVAVRFFGTTVILGLNVTLVTLLVGARSAHVAEATLALRYMVAALIAVILVKLAAEAGILLHLKDRRQTDLKRSARLMVGELADLVRTRFALGLVGGVVLPAFLWLSLSRAQPDMGTSLALALVGLVLLLVGELLERTLFFVAASSPRMPGAIGS